MSRAPFRANSVSSLRQALMFAAGPERQRSAGAVLTRQLMLGRWYVDGRGSFTDRDMQKAVSHGLCEVLETGQLRMTDRVR